MPAKVHTSKVLCYIIRDDQLLVFRHADYDLEHVGIQIPAGSIRYGESPEDAALREAREETGLSQFSIARKLGETVYDITPYRYEIHDGQQPPTRLECFWIPLRDAHVLQAGQGALIGAIFDE
jgi:8-oxo-dGTP pyrophosphatase MutT (NUDIX family)